MSAAVAGRQGLPYTWRVDSRSLGWHLAGLRSFSVASFGVLGVVALLGQAIWRLTPVALEPLRSRQLSAGQMAIYALWVLVSAYSEGYRAFQRGFSPRVVARAVHLARRPEPLHVLLAPAFCMSLFHASRRGLTVAWGISIAVFGLVWLVHHTPQPWRGIIDGGVVVGLLWGLLSLLFFSARALTGHPIRVQTNLPDPSGARPIE
jgi:hypothetical protein